MTMDEIRKEMQSLVSDAKQVIVIAESKKDGKSEDKIVWDTKSLKEAKELLQAALSYIDNEIVKYYYELGKNASSPN